MALLYHESRNSWSLSMICSWITWRKKSALLKPVFLLFHCDQLHGGHVRKVNLMVGSSV